ncbi:MAG: DivIVA domain-containing protein [bacterium]
MALTPNDIRNCELDTQMRGYNKEAVEELLEQIARAMEADKQENLKFSMEIDSLKTQLATLREFEDSIKGAAIDARRNADQTIEDAKIEAVRMLAEAKEQAEALIVSQKEQLRDLEARVARAKATKRTYIDSLRETIESHLSILGNIDTADLADLDDNLEVTDSAEVERDQMETLADRSEENESLEAEQDVAADNTAPIAEQPVPPEAPPEGALKDKPVDPELAQALANYQARVDNQNRADGEPMPPTGGPTVIETDQRAEDIPPGFYVKDPKTGEDITGKIRIAHLRQAHQQVAPGEPPAKVPPEELAQELDKVVAKFEQELDKAAHS